MDEDKSLVRDSAGRFLPGNKLGKGNPLCGRVVALKSAILKAADEDTIVRLMAGLLDIALGDQSSKVRVQATVEYLNRVLGKPTQAIELDVSNAEAPSVPLDLDEAEVAVLERMRARLVRPIEAEEASE